MRSGEALNPPVPPFRKGGLEGSSIDEGWLASRLLTEGGLTKPPFAKGGGGDFRHHSRAFLTALQLSDSFFPTGMYAHSQGMEGMVRQDWVRAAADVEELLAHQLAWSVLPADGVALLHAYRAAVHNDLATVVAIDQRLHALKLPSELRAASCQHGRRLLQETAAFTSHPMHRSFLAAVERRESPGAGAVALGVVSHCLEIPEQWALLAFCHSYCVGVLSAGLRLLPMTHRQAQEILRRLQSLALELAQEIAQRDWREMTSFTPELDIAAMNHESSDLRIFAS
ncbi:MAG: hypothetical protein FJ316_00330 [SAR202 cluster bacterium]|nr:hypothetical protein [SAR202 cluster bacterium]